MEQIKQIIDIMQGSKGWIGWGFSTTHPASKDGQLVMVDPQGNAYKPDEITTLDLVLSSFEAAQLWGITDSTVRAAAGAGKFGNQARRTTKNWIITYKGMEKVFGPRRS